MTTNATIEAIDLTTYYGEDPCLIHEPACQNCHAKQSETQLTRCPTCSVVWYCSEACVEEDFERHRRACRNIVTDKVIIDTKVQELREQHEIQDPFVPKENIPWNARRTHTELDEALTNMAQNVSKLSQQGETKELWKLLLCLQQKLFKMKERRSLESLRAASDVAFIMIRLDRLEDAWRFIRSTLVTYRSYGNSSTVIEYQPQDRYSDCVEWVCTSYWPSLSDYDFEPVRKQFHDLILGLLIIKLRIRFAAARDAWKETVNVFLQTKQGKELEPAKFALEEWFSLSDDSVQVEQIRQLMGIHYYDPSMIPNVLNNRAAVHRNASTCLRRTPKGAELLSALLDSQDFTNLEDNMNNGLRINTEGFLLDRLIYKRLPLDDAPTRARKRHVMLLIGLFFIFAFARLVLIPEPNYSHIGAVIAYASLFIVTIDNTDACIIELLFLIRERHYDMVNGILMIVFFNWGWAFCLAIESPDFDMHFLFLANKWDWMLLMAAGNPVWWLTIPTVPSEPLFGLKDVAWTVKLKLRRWKARLAEAMWIVKSTLQHWCARLTEYGSYELVPAQ